MATFTTAGLWISNPESSGSLFAEKATVFLWNIADRENQVQSIPLASECGVARLEFSPDGRFIAALVDQRKGYYDPSQKQLRIIDIEKGSEAGEPIRGDTIAFGRTMAAALDGDTITLYDARSHRPLGPPLATVSGLRIRPGSWRLARTADTWRRGLARCDCGPWKHAVP